MTTTTATLLGSVAWALAFVGAALVFKGHPLEDWIQGVLLVGCIIFISSQSANGSRCRPRLRRRA